ncbi:MAG: hypothetical protein JNK29_10780 [Anaerolineales bacterium]|nr:hypothetical protein [Anaerolineales bacterium]
MRRVLFSLLTLALFAAACAPGAPATATPEPATPTPIVAGDPTEAQLAAMRALAEQLGLSVDQITVLSSAAVEWPDACLGVARPEARCAQAITPGFRHTLDANGRPYDVHTNADGTAAVVVTATLTWERQGGIAGFCDSLTITRGGEINAANCRGDAPAQARLLDDLLTKEETQLWSDWLARFGAVVIVREDPPAADQMRISLAFTGRGSAQPDEAEQQAMLDLAQSLFERARS